MSLACRADAHSFWTIVVVVALAALVPLTASAQPPTVELVPVNDVQVFAGADSPCPFDVTFTGTGTIKLTTYYDNNGTPIRQSIHGAAWDRQVRDRFAANPRETLEARPATG